jgi:hypothetical protein
VASQVFLLTGCSLSTVGVQTQQIAPGEAPMQIGTPVRNNVTPMEAALGCYARSLAASGRPPLVIGVGEIKDFTGRYSINEGNVITQGGIFLKPYSATSDGDILTIENPPALRLYLLGENVISNAVSYTRGQY